MFNEDRPGCLGGLLQLALIAALFDWTQDKFGFGKGCSCTGLGCGFILLCLFGFAVCSVLMGTDWLSFSFR